MTQRKARQRLLFEETPPIPVVDLPPAVREQLRQGLTQWLLTRAAAMRKEMADE